MIVKRSRPLVLVVAASLVCLVLAAGGAARPQTTNPGAYLTVRVSITNKGISMSPTHARRGQTAIFLLSNLASSAHVFSLGDVSLTHHRGTGFVVKLARNQQKRVLLYLTYRGPLPAWLGNTSKTKIVGVFRVT
ncbi:MAG TPA: hypothetical protein VFA30_08160 [Gaiellaceae bacterium]|nr:hypothetical protein [Gaiellaceae bacterium]